ncbi:hypothetical protein ACS0TY_008410 [Phlomoides rotata]
MFPNDNLQDDFFNGLMWPKSITAALVTFLLTKKQLDTWVWNSNNGPVTLEAREYLNATFHTDYTTIEIVGRVKKLRSRYSLFSAMIAQSGVHWNRELNYVYASIQQWEDQREVYPMSRACMTQGEPLFDDLQALFAPDNGPQHDPIDDDELIIIVDSDDEDMHLFQFPLVHALPVLDQVDIHLPILLDSPVPEVVFISSDECSPNFNGYFDSDVDLGFSDDEDHIPVLMIEDAIEEIINPIPNNTVGPRADELDSPPSASIAAIRESIR